MKKTILLACLVAPLSLPAVAQDGAVYFDGISGRGTAAGVGDLVTNSTWEAWVRMPQYATELNSGAILFRWGMYSHGLYVREDSGAPTMGMYSCPGPEGCGAAPAYSMGEGRWHHLAMVFGPEAGPSGHLYVDGVLKAQCPPLPCNPWSGWETVLGAQGYIGYSEFFRGEIDEARISSVPRYTGNFTPQRRFETDASTIGLWHFDEGGGNVAYDSSGQGRHFTLHGGYEWRGGVTSISTYCSAKTTSAGCVPAIAGEGLASVGSSNSFVVSATQIAPGVNGVLTWSRMPASTPFAGGTMCVGSPVWRSWILSAQPPGGPACSGILQFPFTTERMAASNLAAGDVVHLQVWTRDNGYAPPANWGMTQGLRVTLVP
ncbi:MAG: Serine/threonine-protein kinase PrkC [Planctomycetota bacterium]